MKHVNRLVSPALDVVLNMLLCIMMLYLLALLQVQQKKIEDKSVRKAEVVLTAEWSVERDEDIDIYLKGPSGVVCFFNNKDTGLMSLGRDDRGNTFDGTYVDGKLYSYPENIEHMEIRGLIPGEYILNVHWYRQTKREDIEVKFRAEKLNPYRSIPIPSNVITLKQQGDEKTVIRFTIDINGNITDISNLEQLMVGQQGFQGPRE